MTAVHREQIRTSDREMRPNVMLSKNATDRPINRGPERFGSEVNECHSDKCHQEEKSSGKQKKPSDWVDPPLRRSKRSRKANR